MNKKNWTKKLLPGIFFVLFLVVSGYFFSGEYTSFLEFQKKETQAKRESLSQLSFFSLPKSSFSSDGKLFFTPDKMYLKTLISLIKTAQKKVYINVYMLTEKGIRSALVEAKKRGVEVKVILEKNVYGSAGINQPAFDQLESFGVEVKWSSNDAYSLDHAKYFLIDDTAIISTGNLTASTFSSNRDIFYQTQELKLFSVLETIFLNDFHGNFSPVYFDPLVVSPWYSRKKLEVLFSSAKKSLDIYMPYMNDQSLAQILLSQLKKGILIRIITGQSDIEDDFFRQIQQLGGTVVFLKKAIHAKSVVVDGKILYLGSENFSTPSLDENKELGIILSSSGAISEWERVFNSDL